MAGSLDFTFRLVPLTLKLLEARGASLREREALLALLPAGAAEAAAITAPLAQVQRFLEEAEALARVPSFGLTLATAVPRGTYAELEFISRLACTLEEAMRAVGRFYRLINKGADLAYIERGDFAGLDIRVHGCADGWGRQLNEYTVALLHRITREVSPGWQPTRVWFAHPPPGNAALEALLGYFGAPLSFDGATCGFEGPSALVDAPLSSSDAELQRLLEARASERLERDVPLAAFSERVRGELSRRLSGGDLGAGAVAAALDVSVRTLQRRLKDEGASYQALLDAVRAQVAKDWLANGRRDVGALAGKLGYAEPAAVGRAFRRWTGRSPTAWRSVTRV